MQIIYDGQTELKFKFPEEFNITYSVNHWSNKEKEIKLIEKFLLLYVRNKKEKSLTFVQPKRLLIADMFKEQLTNKVKILIEKHVKIVSVPHNMTNYFQSLDLTGNPSCQLFLHDKAQL